MSAHPPDIEALRDCASDAGRARWLLRCPLALLLREEGHIRRALQKAGFRAGLAYLGAELSFLRDGRSDDGGPSSYMAISVARGRMSRIACGLPPLNLGT